MARTPSSRVQLTAPGWTARNRRALERLIQAGAGRRLPAVFDFDNTLVCGDIGEAVLAVLSREGRLNSLPQTLCPPFLLPDNRRVALEDCADPTEYYSAFLAPTCHGRDDPTPLANAYALAVEALTGLTPQDVAEATRTAFELGQTRRPAMIEVTPGKTTFPAPFFYPEMVELIAQLVRHDYDVWVLSASNVWSVRWMVQHGLKPMLRTFGVREVLEPDHVVGISTLLSDRSGRLYKDVVLVHQDRSYARLEPERLCNLILTSRLQFPVPTYSGKVACLFDRLPDRPYLCVGDSPGDHAMLAYGEHRLWMARLDKPASLKATLELRRTTEPESWLFQPVLTKQAPGLVPDPAALRRSSADASPAIRQSLSLLGRVA